MVIVTVVNVCSSMFDVCFDRVQFVKLFTHLDVSPCDSYFIATDVGSIQRIAD